MSRSRKKTPITGYTTERSEKAFKRIENQRQRAAIRSGKEFIPESYGPKDGRQWIGDSESKEFYPKAMRK